jgi:hypothetical protein
MIKINSVPVSAVLGLGPVGDAATGGAEVLLVKDLDPELLWPRRRMDGRRQRLRLRFRAWLCGRPKRRRRLGHQRVLRKCGARPRWRKTALLMQTPAHRRQIVTSPEQREIYPQICLAIPPRSCRDALPN